MRPWVLALALAAVAPGMAAAQGWKAYPFPDAGFTVQLPAAPKITTVPFKTPAGATVQARTYALKEADADYSMTVADFRQQKAEPEATMTWAVKQVAAGGQIKVDVTERVGSQYGHQLSVVTPDGGRSSVSIFFVDGLLYQLVGRALPPDPSLGQSKAVRFSQSLEFTGANEGFKP